MLPPGKIRQRTEQGEVRFARFDVLDVRRRAGASSRRPPSFSAPDLDAPRFPFHMIIQMITMMITII